jgi:hypothetical protein
MVRRNPARSSTVVREALDTVRINLSDVADWLSPPSADGSTIPVATLKNYRDGRREMPKATRRLLAHRLRRHAEQLAAIATKLEKSGE